MKRTVEEQIRIITKGTASVVSTDELKEKLIRSERTKRPLTVKLGLDPSAPDIHIGHAVVLRKIRQIQDLGHIAVIIIGDFTGKIGDPTGKVKGRNSLSEEEVRANAATYQEQVFRIIDPDRTVIRYNSEWLKKLTFEDVIKLASSTTVARILERDDFSNRYKNNMPIGLHEFLYPLMQAYDSIAIGADIELGGTDQTFNILMGRNLQKSMDKEQQVAIFMPILEGLDGREKMSKSLGNYIGINEPANVMFKKCMEIPDRLISKFFELATDEHPVRIDEIRKELAEGRNPRDIKLELAKTITELYHTEEETVNAENFYSIAFGKKAIPDDIPDMDIKEACTLADVIPLLVKNGHVTSSSECRRLIQQGGIQKNGEKIDDITCPIADRDVLKIGKKKFVRIIK